MDEIEGALRRSLGWAKATDWLRIDGSVASKARQASVDAFNSLSSSHKAFLFTSAGAVGVNLVAATRMIVYDAMWNPATTAQASACRAPHAGSEC